MVRALVRLLAVVGGLAIAFVLLVVVMLVVRALPERVPGRVLLELELAEPLQEQPPDALARLVLGEEPTLRDVVVALDRAGRDERVRGLVVTLRGTSFGMAQAQELRDAVRAFRRGGKPALAFAETFGEFGPGGVAYYVASAFDEVWLQPSGDVGLTGVLAESPFFRGTLDRLGVEPQLARRSDYKTAMNVFTETGFTPAHRESLESITSSVFRQMVAGIAEGRSLSPEAVRQAVASGPQLGAEAVRARLVDGLAYRDEVYRRALDKAGEGAERLSLQAYRERAGRLFGSRPRVALIHGVGTVVRGESRLDPLTRTWVMGSDTVAKAFREAVDDEDVKAILFRVDSPGGSYVASDTVWRETVRARKAGKPVVVSMGNLAASGGYFVAMAADAIVAQPGTLTGSIGVFGGKLVTRELWNKLGVRWDSVQQGGHADMWSSVQEYSPEEWARLEASLDRIYGDFTAKVAQGRNLPLERVLEVAQGRVWTGEDAKARGLVDELGGYATALAEVRRVAKLSADAELDLRVFPRPRSALEQLLERDEPGSEPIAAAVLAATEDLAPVARRLRASGALGHPGVLAMPAIELR